MPMPKCHIRLDYDSASYSEFPEQDITAPSNDLPAVLAKILRDAGFTVDVTTDSHRCAAGQSEMDTVKLATPRYSGEILKLLADTGLLFDLYVQLGRRNLGNAGAQALIRLGKLR